MAKSVRYFYVSVYCENVFFRFYPAKMPLMRNSETSLATIDISINIVYLFCFFRLKQFLNILFITENYAFNDIEAIFGVGGFVYKIQDLTVKTISKLFLFFR